MNNYEKDNITPQLLSQWIQEEKDGNTELTQRIGFAFLYGDGGIQPNVQLGLKYLDKAAVECNNVEAQYKADSEKDVFSLRRCPMCRRTAQAVRLSSCVFSSA